MDDLMSDTPLKHDNPYFPHKKKVKEDKNQRLAKALRENLRKRKEQARLRLKVKSEEK
jgi:hypothetical protein